MSDQNNDNKIYDASAIQRYLNGQMSASEMHALEYAALEDPFLADAIEGYNQNKFYKETDIATDLKDLRGRLTSRIESKNEHNIISLFKVSRWKIAAIILVIAGSASVIYYLVFPSSSSNEAVIATYKPPEQKVNKEDTILKEINTANSTSIAVTDVKRKPATLEKLRHHELASHNAAPELASRNAAPDIAKSTPSPTLSSAPVRSQPDSLAADNASEERITSLPESKIMQSKSATASLFETIKKKDEAVLKRSIVTQDAVPVIGWPAFNRYLENSKRAPADSSNIPGEVIVSFMVREDGELSDFKIEKSLSKKSDNEALRLIKEGPAWKVLKKERVKATITIKF